MTDSTNNQGDDALQLDIPSLAARWQSKLDALASYSPEVTRAELAQSLVELRARKRRLVPRQWLGALVCAALVGGFIYWALSFIIVGVQEFDIRGLFALFTALFGLVAGFNMVDDFAGGLSERVKLRELDLRPLGLGELERLADRVSPVPELARFVGRVAGTGSIVAYERELVDDALDAHQRLWMAERFEVWADQASTAAG